MMPAFDVLGEKKKHLVMQDTWGHMYPKGGSKHYGEIVIAVGEYGDQIVVSSDFPGLDSSPQRYELDHSIFDRLEICIDPGVYHIKCGMWFYKNSNDMYLGKPIGKLINIKVEKIH